MGIQHQFTTRRKSYFLIQVPYVCLVKVHIFSINMSLLSSTQRVPRASYPFRRNIGRSDKGSILANLNALVEVPNVVLMKVHVLRFNVILVSNPQLVLRPSYPFPRKLKSLIEVLNVVRMKVHLLSFNMILISSQQRALTPSYPFLGKLGL